MTSELNELALQLEADDRFRVLRKIESPRAREDCNLPAGARRIALVDVETTGLDARHDRIIELAVMTIDVDCDRGCAVLSNTVPMSWLEDPHRTLDERIVRLTGITDEMLIGERIDDEAVLNLLQSADLIVAHNARFDRAFVEARFPDIKSKAWACSCNEIDWLAHRFEGRSLNHLLMQFGLFNAAHRAADDVWSLFHLLTVAPRGEGGDEWRSFLDYLVEASDTETFIVEAVRAPFRMKDQLKARGYHWNPVKRVWWTELTFPLFLKERGWLERQGLYEFTAAPIDATQRHR